MALIDLTTQLDTAYANLQAQEASYQELLRTQEQEREDALASLAAAKLAVSLARNPLEQKVVRKRLGDPNPPETKVVTGGPYHFEVLASEP